MRGIHIAAIGFLVVGGAACAARADLTPVSQNRSVKSTVSGTYTDVFGVSQSPSPDQMQSATDYSPFVGAVTSGFGVPLNVVGSDVSDATQTSQLGSTIITASGGANASSARFASVMTPVFRYNYTATADSSFQYTFSVSTPTPILLGGSIQTTTTENFAANGVASITLSMVGGPIIASVSAPTGGPNTRPPSPYVAGLSATDTLQPGTYVLSAHASAAPFLVAPTGDYESQGGSFQLNLQAVPESTCALIVLAGILLKRRRANYGA